MLSCFWYLYCVSVFILMFLVLRLCFLIWFLPFSFIFEGSFFSPAVVQNWMLCFRFVYVIQLKSFSYIPVIYNNDLNEKSKKTVSVWNLKTSRTKESNKKRGVKHSPNKQVDMKPYPTAPHLTAGTQWADAHCPLTLMDKIMECNNGAQSTGLQTPNVHHWPPCHRHRHINTQVMGGEGPRLWYQTLILFLPPLYVRQTDRETDV